MKRKPMVRTSMLSRTRRAPEEASQSKRTPAYVSGPIRSVVARSSKTALPFTKVVPLESEIYRRLVADMPCIRCGRVGQSQAAHPNVDKAKGAKKDDRMCFPLCVQRLGEHGCHYLWDQHKLVPKGERGAVEQDWGRRTRFQVIAAGNWPLSLPRWSKDD